MLNIIIKNMVYYATDYNYIVASAVNGDLWFYGAWNNKNLAYEAAMEIGGIVIKNPEKVM